MRGAKTMFFYLYSNNTFNPKKTHMNTKYLLRDEMLDLIRNWLVEWNAHQLEKVMNLLHEEVIFENWTGSLVKGKKDLKRAWIPWFNNHGNFAFITEDLFADPIEQKVLLQWKLAWPSTEKHFEGQAEIRRGIDIIHFKDGLIYRKYSYSKTTITIQDKPVALTATQNTPNQ